MNKWHQSILDWWDPMRGYHFYIAIACLTSSLIPVWMKLAMGSLAILNLISYRDIVERASVIIYAILLPLAVYSDYFAAANHMFVAAYFSLFIAIWRNHWIPYFNYTRFLIVTVFILATVHKLVSAHFMEGSLMGEYILHGESFTIISSLLFPEMPTVIDSYTTSFDLLEISGESPVGLAINIPDEIVQYLQFTSWIIALGEIAISLILVFAWPKVRYLSLLIFLVLTLLFRTELFFFGTVCLLTLFDKDLFKTRLSAVYIISFTAFMTATVFLVYTWKYI